MLHPKNKLTGSLQSTSLGFHTGLKMSSDDPWTLAKMSELVCEATDTLIDNTPAHIFTQIGFAQPPDTSDDHALLIREPGTRQLRMFSEENNAALLERADAAEPRGKTVDVAMVFANRPYPAAGGVGAAGGATADSDLLICWKGTLRALTLSPSRLKLALSASCRVAAEGVVQVEERQGAVEFHYEQTAKGHCEPRSPQPTPPALHRCFHARNAER